MKLHLADIIEKLHKEKKTGMLNIAMTSDKMLFKIYFKNGEIYHISYGFKKGMESLKSIFDKELSVGNFIPDVALDLISNDLPKTREIIEFLKNTNLRLSFCSNFVHSDNRLYKIRDKLKRALIAQIGPIGSKIVDNVIQDKLNAKTLNAKSDILELVEILSEEIEDEEEKRNFQIELKEFIEELYR